MAIIKIAGLDPAMRNFGMVKGNLDTKSADFDNIELHLIQTDTDSKHKKIVRTNVIDLERCQKLYNEAFEFLQDVDLLFVELPVGSQSAAAMKSYGMCIAICAALKKPIIHVTATQVKLAGHGTKNATKQQMIDWAVSEYPELPWLRYKKAGEMVLNNANEHLADALAAIHAGVCDDQFAPYKLIN